MALAGEVSGVLSGFTLADISFFHGFVEIYIFFMILDGSEFHAYLEKKKGGGGRIKD